MSSLLSVSERSSTNPLVGEVRERRPVASATTRTTFGGRAYDTSSSIAAQSKRASVFKQRAVETLLSADDARCFSLVRSRIDADDAKPESRATERTITSYAIDVLTELEIVKRSVVQVTSSQCILARRSHDAAGKPSVEHYQNPYGPLSLYMGPIDRSAKCDTCGGSFHYDDALNPSQHGVYSCPGHSGHVYLCGATFSPVFMTSQNPSEIHLLKSICWMCGELPASRAKCDATIARALQCDAVGRPPDRRARLEIIARAMQAEKYCHACQARLRCDVCRDAESQCASCARLLEFRPVIRRRQRGHSTNEFHDFPHVVTWRIESLRNENERAAFEAFKRRHPRLTETELTLNPERARAMFAVVSPDVALLLAPDLPRGPYGKTGDLYARVYGSRRSPAELSELRLSAVKAVKEFFHAQTSRVLSVMEHVTTPTRINGGLHNVTLNESTKIICAIVNTVETIKKKAAFIPNEGKRAYCAVPTTGVPQHGLGANVDETSINAAIDHMAFLRHAPGAYWYERTLADHVLLANEYGTLQFYVCMLIDPRQAPMWHPKGSSAPRPNSGRPGAGGVKQKQHAPVLNIKGKDSLFRGHLLGKRVNFSGRDVITPDPELDIDEVGVPRVFAGKWPFTETINSINFRELLDAAEHRRQTVSTINSVLAAHKVDSFADLPVAVQQRLQANASLDQMVVSFGGRLPLYLWNAEQTERYDYTTFDRAVHDHPLARRTGSKIDRPAQDGDGMPFNRAPSLHAVSFMTHTIRIMHGLSLRLPPQDTTPYNADFDGDEMNAHFPTTLAGVAEMSLLTQPSNNIIMSRTSSCGIATVQESLLGAFKLSLPTTLLTFAEACHLVTFAITKRRPDAWEAQDAKAPRLPTPAVYVRCPGDGRHSRFAAASGAATCCHELHEEFGERCKRPCNTHYKSCQAHTDATLPCSGAVRSTVCSGCDRPHMVPYWTGLQLVSLFLPEPFSASKTTKFSPQQLGFRATGDCRTPAPASVNRPSTPAELWAARLRSDCRDEKRIPLDKDEKKELHLGNVPWCIVRGEMLYGTLNKQAIGVGHGNIVQKLLMSTGMPSADDATGQYPERNRLAAKRFLSAVNKMAIAHLTTVGFSVGYNDLELNNKRVDAQVRLLIYGVKPPVVPDDMPIEEKRSLDPIKYHKYMRYDTTADDAEAIEPAELDRLKIPYEKGQLGVERKSIQLIQEWEHRERKVRARVVKDADAGEMAFSFAKRRARVGARIRSHCDAVRDKVHSTIIAAMTQANGLWHMVSAGSKGSAINIGSMIGCIGQQVSNGKRPCDAMDASLIELDQSSAADTQSRWYAHFPVYPIYPAGAGGFVKRGYRHGSRRDPVGFFVQNIGGRDGLVDTATKTAETGYMQRRLGKNGESHRLAADGTVRNEVNKIVTTWPAGVRIDPRFLMATVCEPYSMPTADFEATALTLPSESASDMRLVQLCDPSSVELAIAAAEREARRCRSLLTQFRSLLDYDNSGARIRVPGDIGGIIADSMHQSRCSDLFDVAHRGYAMTSRQTISVEWRTDVVARTAKHGKAPLTVEYAVERFEAWLNDSEVAKHDLVTLAHVSLTMTAKQLIVRFQMPRDVYDDVLHRYRRFLIFARAQTGDAIGIILGQSMGEPLTQMTLQTFYVAGREAPVTRGVPRFSELLMMSKTVKTPMIETHFDLCRVFAEEARRETAATFARCVVDQLAAQDLSTRTERAVAMIASAAAAEMTDGAVASASAFLEKSDAMTRKTRSQALGATVQSALYGEDVLRNALVAGRACVDDGTWKDVGVDRLHAVVSAACDCVAVQYSWTLDTAFCAWTTTADASTVSSALSAYSKSVVNSLLWRAGVLSLLGAAVSAEFACSLRERLEPLEATERDAYVQVVLTQIAAAAAPLLGVHSSVVCVPLHSEQHELLGVAFIAFTKTPKRVVAVYDELRLKRAEVPVLYPATADVRRAAAVSQLGVCELARRHLEQCVDVALGQVGADGTRSGVDRDHEAQTLRDALLLAPVRQTLPRVLLGDVLTLARVEYAPLRRVGRNVEQIGHFADCNEWECAEIESQFYGDPDDFVGGCRCERCAAAPETDSPLDECRPATLCLGSFVLAMRIDRDWLVAADYDPALIGNTLRRYLGANYSVFVGDLKNKQYVSLHIRLHTCRLSEIANRTYGTTQLALKNAAYFAAPRLVDVFDDELVAAAQAGAEALSAYYTRQCRQLALARTDGAPVPIADDPVLLRELRLDLGFGLSPEPLYVTSLLFAELRKRLFRLVRAWVRSVRHMTVSEETQIVAEYVAWTKAVHAYYDANLPAASREEARLSVPAPPRDFEPSTVGRLLRARDVQTLVQWLTYLMHFVDAHTPLWKMGRHGAVLLVDTRPTPPAQLDIDMIAAMRLFCVFDDGRDPLGHRPNSLQPLHVSREQLAAQAAGLRTETEVNELARVLGVICNLHFVGSSTVADMQTRLQKRSVCTPEGGVETIDFTVADIATTQFVNTLALRNVDKRRTITNNMHDVNRTLGIEATRSVLIKQYSDVFQMTGSHGATLHGNLAHLAGMQTSFGICLPISRLGARYLIADALTEAGNEQAPAVLTKAALANTRVDAILSPSAAMMMALPTPGFGTSASQVLMDTAAFLPNERGEIRCTPIEVPSVESLIDEVFPLTDGSMASLPTLSSAGAQTAQSPFTSFSPEAYDAVHVVPPTHATLRREIEFLDIDTVGSFSPRRAGSVEPDDSDDDAVLMPPPPPRKPRALDYSSTAGFDESTPQTTWLYRRSQALVAPSSDQYDPLRPAYDAAAPSPTEYDPTNAATTDTRVVRLVENGIATSYVADASTASLLQAIQAVRERSQAPQLNTPPMPKRRRTLDNVNY